MHSVLKNNELEGKQPANLWRFSHIRKKFMRPPVEMHHIWWLGRVNGIMKWNRNHIWLGAHTYGDLHLGRLRSSRKHEKLVLPIQLAKKVHSSSSSSINVYHSSYSLNCNKQLWELCVVSHRSFNQKVSLYMRMKPHSIHSSTQNYCVRLILHLSWWDCLQTSHAPFALGKKNNGKKHH